MAPAEDALPVALKAPVALIQAISDGRRLGLNLHSIYGMAWALKRSGAAWNVARRMWVTPTSEPVNVERWLRQQYAGQHVDFADCQRMVAASLKSPEPDYFTQVLDVQVFPLARGDFSRGRYAVSFAYDALAVRAMRVLHGLFHKPASAWQVQGEPDHILRVLADVAGVAPEFAFIHERPVVLEAMVESAAAKSPIQVPAAPPVRGVEGGPQIENGNGYLSTELEARRFALDESAIAAASAIAGLRDYQVAGVRHLLGQSGACLGDDMGLGKSRQTVVATRMAAGSGRVLIVCPASLRINWEREIQMVYPDAIVGMVGEDRMAALQGCQWVIANYERLGGLVREPGLKFAVMAIDEAHYLKEHKSGRTRNAFMLATRIPRRYVVTGTPLLSREMELHTLLRLTGHPLGHLTLKDFRKEYTGDQDRRARLAAALKGWMLRRKKDMLSDLGEKTRQVRWISPAEGLGAYKAIYADPSMQAMPKIVRLRQCLEALKTEFLIETVQSLAEGDKIIVFCEYMATVHAMTQAFAASGIACVSLVGSDSATKRQKAIDAFQDDPNVTVFIGTTSAAGVGITLTAANYVAFASLPWTPALMRQAEDRAYRLGQKRNVVVLVPLIEHTIDEGVWKLLQSKHETEQEVVEAVRCALSEPEPQLEPVS